MTPSTLSSARTIETSEPLRGAAGRGLAIGLVSDVLAHWQGGRDLYRTLYQALELVREPNDDIYVLSRFAARPRVGRILRETRQLMHGRTSLRGVWDEIRLPTGEALRESFGVPRSVAVRDRPRESHGRRAFVVGPISYVQENVWDAPAVGYIADLQHLDFPEFFQPEELPRRDEIFRRLVTEVPIVLVNSKAVKASVERHYDAHDCRLTVMPMCPCPEEAWLSERVDAPRIYGIERPYYLSSNQFWKHKNHPTLLRAIKILKDEGADPLVVFTGATDDYRNPDYFASLQRLIAELGIADNVRILGLIPKTHQIDLLRQAIAMVQTTLFEGGPGGGAAHDALAMGGRLVVSDIDINREIPKSPTTLYFEPHSAPDLAVAMIRAAGVPNPRQSDSELLDAGRRARRELGLVIRQAFVDAVLLSGQAAGRQSVKP